ncbi:hypothetical protein L596_014762 [Steinernema carpocapsae]|uniref:Aminotransferase class I/classII large domain-containing protein n=1 Tax=Steinernema carpocapsae TaxID=34508 RepID=A0A4U5NDP1_STECR|nr:hypothetical protein L596_014762 [Steinernema carpocapsae]
MKKLRPDICPINWSLVRTRRKLQKRLNLLSIEESHLQASSNANLQVVRFARGSCHDKRGVTFRVNCCLVFCKLIASNDFEIDFRIPNEPRRFLESEISFFNWTEAACMLLHHLLAFRSTASLHSARLFAAFAAMSSTTSRKPSELAVAASKPSIWVEFTTLASECKAVNIGQGFPDSPAPKFVADLLENISKHPEKTAWHQYTRGFGHARLVKALAELYSNRIGHPVDANDGVLVTVGAYLALYYTFLGWLNKGDEVIVLEPAYDCYIPQIQMTGAVPVPVVLELTENPETSADYRLDPKVLEAHITEKTKMIVLNNPHNPTGKLFTREELQTIADLAEKNDLLVVADEVYEFHVYKGHEMIKFASLPGMYNRTITIGSAGKAFSVTGWKLGWAMGPPELLTPLKAIHQNCVFTCSTPTQEALAEAFEKELAIIVRGAVEESYLLTGLARELQAKRDHMAACLREAGLKPVIPDAGYFMMADFSSIDGPFKAPDASGDPMDFRFVRWLCREKKLATIPPSAFYSPEFKEGHANMIRLCFFKTDDTLEEARKILHELGSKNC